MIAEVYEHSAILLAALGIASIVSIIAWLSGYYRLPKSLKSRQVHIGPAILAFLLYFFVQLVLIPIGIFIFVYFKSGSFPEKIGSHFSKFDIGWINLLSILIATSAVFVTSLVLGAKIRKTIWNFGELSFWEQIKSAAIGILTWVLAYPLVVIISQFVIIVMILWFGESPPDIDQEMVKHLKGIAGDRALFLFSLAAVIILVPIAEELLFRGFLQNWLRSFLPLSYSIGLTSLLFALLHFSTGQSALNWQLIPALFALSCYLGYVYEREQTLIAPISLHMTVNAISIAILFV